MTTRAADGKQWSEAELDGLVVEKGFRLRGMEATRLETFVDAAFAFVLTLLVISFDDIPKNYPEMLAAAKRIPGFAASFAVLMMFWLQHRRWSRRYGLENAATIVQSLALIFVVLVYIYPLRMLFEGMFANLSGGLLPTSYRITSYDELRMIFVFYSVGFFAMSLLVGLLYRSASSNATRLALNELEQRKTRVELQVWSLSAGFSLLSILVALTVPNGMIQAAGYMYIILLGVMRLPAYLDRCRHATSAKES